MKNTKSNLACHCIMVVFEEEYQEQTVDVIEAYDRVQADYAGARATTSWSQRLAEQFGQAEPSSTRKKS